MYLEIRLKSALSGTLQENLIEKKQRWCYSAEKKKQQKNAINQVRNLILFSSISFSFDIGISWTVFYSVRVGI